MSEPPDFRLERSELRGEDEFGEFGPDDLEYYVDVRGTFDKLPLCPDDASLAASGADVAIVGAPTDDGTSGRPGARFGPRAIRSAPTTWGRDAWSIQLEVEPYERLAVVDAGDAPVVPSRHARALRVIHEKVFRVAERERDPGRPGRRPLDHVPVGGGGRAARLAEEGRRGALRRACRRGGLDLRLADLARYADAPAGRRGVGRRVRTSSRSGLRGYWPEKATFDWMREQGFRWHTIVEIEERGVDAVIDDAIAEALDGPEVVYLSVDIDVVDPGMAPGTGTPEPGGLTARELLRAVRRIVGAVELAGMDVVEVSPPYDQSEVTSMLAYRVVMEALSSLAARRG